MTRSSKRAQATFDAFIHAVQSGDDRLAMKAETEYQRLMVRRSSQAEDSQANAVISLNAAEKRYETLSFGEGVKRRSALA